MSHTNTRRTEVLTQLSKPIVTQFTGSHLNAYLMQIGIRPCVKMCSVQLNAKFLTEFHTKSLVPIRLNTTKMEIAMSCMYVETAFF